MNTSCIEDELGSIFEQQLGCLHMMLSAGGDFFPRAWRSPCIVAMLLVMSSSPLFISDCWAATVPVQASADGDEMRDLGYATAVDVPSKEHDAQELDSSVDVDARGLDSDDFRYWEIVRESWSNDHAYRLDAARMLHYFRGDNAQTYRLLWWISEPSGTIRLWLLFSFFEHLTEETDRALLKARVEELTVELRPHVRDHKLAEFKSFADGSSQYAVDCCRKYLERAGQKEKSPSRIIDLPPQPELEGLSLSKLTASAAATEQAIHSVLQSCSLPPNGRLESDRKLCILKRLWYLASSPGVIEEVNTAIGRTRFSHPPCRENCVFYCSLDKLVEISDDAVRKRLRLKYFRLVAEGEGY